ncbi:hypothetical protein ADK38_10655, partial [Streptomyces varsoviensis]
MSIMMPSGLKWVADLAGGEWPEADEDKCWELSQRHKDYAADMRSAAASAREALADFKAGVTGGTAQQFAAFLEKMAANYEQVADSADELGDNLDEFALNVQYSKMMILAMLGWMAAEIAFFAWWAPEALPEIYAQGRLAIGMIMRRLLMATGVNAAVGAGLSLGIQGIQFALHRRHSLDWKEVGVAAGAGAISGAITGGLFAGAGLSRIGQKTISTLLGKMLVGGAGGAASMAATNAAFDMDGSPLLGFLAGAVGGAIGHIPTAKANFNAKYGGFRSYFGNFRNPPALDLPDLGAGSGKGGFKDIGLVNRGPKVRNGYWELGSDGGSVREGRSGPPGEDGRPYSSSGLSGDSRTLLPGRNGGATDGLSVDAPTSSRGSGYSPAVFSGFSGDSRTPLLRGAGDGFSTEAPPSSRGTSSESSSGPATSVGYPATRDGSSSTSSGSSSGGQGGRGGPGGRRGAGGREDHASGSGVSSLSGRSGVDGLSEVSRPDGDDGTPNVREAPGRSGIDAPSESGRVSAGTPLTPDNLAGVPGPRSGRLDSWLDGAEHAEAPRSEAPQGEHGLPNFEGPARQFGQEGLAGFDRPSHHPSAPEQHVVTGDGRGPGAPRPSHEVSEQGHHGAGKGVASGSVDRGGPGPSAVEPVRSSHQDVPAEGGPQGARPVEETGQGGSQTAHGGPDEGVRQVHDAPGQGVADRSSRSEGQGTGQEGGGVSGGLTGAPVSTGASSRPAETAPRGTGPTARERQAEQVERVEDVTDAAGGHQVERYPG